VEAFWADGKRKVLVKDQLQQNFDHLFESEGRIIIFTIFYCFMKDKDSYLLPGSLSSLVFLIYILLFTHEPYRWYLVYSSIVMIFSISLITK